MRLTFVLLPAAFVIASSFGQDRTAEEKALREMWSQFEERFNKGDAAGVASLYAPDGDRINPQGEVAHGRAEVQKQYEAIFVERASTLPRQDLQSTISIRFLRPDVALLDGKWEADGPDGKIRGHFSVTATKEEGKWWIAAGRDRGEVRP